MIPSVSVRCRVVPERVLGAPLVLLGRRFIMNCEVGASILFTCRISRS